MRNLHGSARRLEMRDTRKEGVNNLSKASGDMSYCRWEDIYAEETHMVVSTF